MIIDPFDVVSKGKRWRFVDSNAVDSGVERDQIQQFAVAQMQVMQQDATCVALGIAEVGAIGNIAFGVYDGEFLSGVMLVAALDYRSGPWADLTSWEIVSNAPAIFHARPMPSFPSLTLGQSLDLSMDAAHHLMARRLRSVNGHEVKFKRLSWAMFKDRDDVESRFVKRVYAKALADNRFTIAESPDPAQAARTLVDLELR